MLAHALSREKNDEARRWPREFTRTPIVTRARVLATRTGVCPRVKQWAIGEEDARGPPLPPRFIIFAGSRPFYFLTRAYFASPYGVIAA